MNVNEKSKEKNDSNRKMTWEQFQKQLSDKIDMNIITYAKKTGKVYMGGKCKFSSDIVENEFGKQTFLIAYIEMYFREQFVNKAEMRNASEKHNFDEFDHENDEDTLKKLREILSTPYEVDIVQPVLEK